MYTFDVYHKNYTGIQVYLDIEVVFMTRQD